MSDQSRTTVVCIDRNGTVVGAAETRLEDGRDVFVLMWADPDGSWRFFAVADTAEFRVKLVNASVIARGTTRRCDGPDRRWHATLRLL